MPKERKRCRQPRCIADGLIVRHEKGEKGQSESTPFAKRALRGLSLHALCACPFGGVCAAQAKGRTVFLATMELEIALPPLNVTVPFAM